MSSTSFITLSFLIKAWILGLLVYAIRATSSEFNVKPHIEICLYIIAGVAVLKSESIFGISLGGGSDMRMNRQESDLVKDYLSHRQQGETLGDFITRVEMEEEQAAQQHDREQTRKRNRRSNDGSRRPRSSRVQ